MNPSHASSRRRRRPDLRPEALESRQLLAGELGNTFALVKADVAQAGATIDVPFTIDPAVFTRPRGRMVIGIEPVPQTGSPVQPLVTAVIDPHGNKVNQAIHTIYNPHLPPGAVAATELGTDAFLSPLVSFPGQPGRAATYTVQVQALNNTAGPLLLDFYLPGDATGDGRVNDQDFQVVRSLLNTTKGQEGYLLSADVNRDGRIGQIDLAYTLQNKGVGTTISPVLSANLDPATDTGRLDRVTASRVVHFSGAASPGAVLTFTEATNKAPAATAIADASGLYHVNLTLGDGLNTFKVSSADAFGQVIEGQLAPVLYNPDAPASPMPALPASSQTASRTTSSPTPVNGQTTSGTYASPSKFAPLPSEAPPPMPAPRRTPQAAEDSTPTITVQTGSATPSGPRARAGNSVQSAVMPGRPRR